MPDINMQVFEEAKRNQLVTEVDIQTQVALDDYQVQLSNIANPTQSQDNVVIDRFGEFLPHWNESLDFDTWVKMNMEITGKRILMLRGNSNVSSKSSVSNVMIDGWDFELDTIGNPPDEWTEDDADGDFHVIAGKRVNLLHSSAESNTSLNYAAITSITNDNDRILEFDMEVNISGEYNYVSLNNTNTVSVNGAYLSVHSGNLYYYSGGWILLMAISINTLYHIKIYNIDITNDNFDIDVNDVNKGANLNFGGAVASINYIQLNGGGSENCDSEYDNIIIRKQTTTEPTVTAYALKNISTALKSLGRAG